MCIKVAIALIAVVALTQGTAPRPLVHQNLYTPQQQANTAILAMKRTNKSVPDLDRQIFEFADIAAYSREFIRNHSAVRGRTNVCKYENTHVDMKSCGIASLWRWDFTFDGFMRTEFASKRLDVSCNNLKRVSDKETKFGELDFLDLSHNKIDFVDLSKTKLKTLDLSHNKLTNIADIKFPRGSVHPPEVHMCNNPIASIENYQFPKLFLKLANCSIASLENVVFDTEETRVDISENPIRRMKNVTIKDFGTDYFYLVRCGITLPMLKEFDLRFVGVSSVVLDLSGNEITVQQLKEEKFRLPDGVRAIHIGDNDTYP